MATENIQCVIVIENRKTFLKLTITAMIINLYAFFNNNGTNQKTVFF